MTERQPDRLLEAQQARAHARIAFFHRFLDQLLIFLADPSQIESVRAAIAEESRRVSESLDATDQALIDRVTAIVWTEQERSSAQIAELRAQLPHQGEP